MNFFKKAVLFSAAATFQMLAVFAELSNQTNETLSSTGDNNSSLGNMTSSTGVQSPHAPSQASVPAAIGLVGLLFVTGVCLWGKSIYRGFNNKRDEDQSVSHAKAFYEVVNEDQPADHSRASYDAIIEEDEPLRSGKISDEAAENSDVDSPRAAQESQSYQEPYDNKGYESGSSFTDDEDQNHEKPKPKKAKTPRPWNITQAEEFKTEAEKFKNEKPNHKPTVFIPRQHSREDSREISQVATTPSLSVRSVDLNPAPVDLDVIEVRTSSPR